MRHNHVASTLYDNLRHVPAGKVVGLFARMFVHYSETVYDIFTKLGTNIRRCLENKNGNSSYIFEELMSFVNFSMEIVSA